MALALGFVWSHQISCRISCRAGAIKQKAVNNDLNLLRQFARTGDDGPFREVVARHFDLVYSVALRQVNGDLHLAQDIAQMVFSCSQLSPQACVEELVIRPQLGDL